MFESLFECIRFKLGDNAQNDKNELKLITDPDMFIFFEKGARGRIYYTYNRYSKGNIKYLKVYDPKQKSKHIIYLDANNLYVYECLSLFQQVDSKG